MMSHAPKQVIALLVGAGFAIGISRAELVLDPAPAKVEAPANAVPSAPVSAAPAPAEKTVTVSTGETRIVVVPVTAPQAAQVAAPTAPVAGPAPVSEPSIAGDPAPALGVKAPGIDEDRFSKAELLRRHRMREELK